MLQYATLHYLSKLCYIKLHYATLQYITFVMRERERERRQASGGDALVEKAGPLLPNGTLLKREGGRVGPGGVTRVRAGRAPPR